MRGQAGVDLDSLETLLVRFSQLLADFPEIQEVDINPLLAEPGADHRPGRPCAARARPTSPKTSGRAWPSIPIRTSTRTPFTLRDGAAVTVRPSGPRTSRSSSRLHDRHSEHTIRMRFFSLVKTLSRDSLIRLCHLDYDREMALAAVQSARATAT